MVGMWLQGDVSNCTLRAFTRLLECVGFRVLEFLVNIKAFSYNLALRSGDNAPNQWAGTDQCLSLIGQVECTAHHFRVKLGRSCVH